MKDKFKFPSLLILFSIDKKLSMLPSIFEKNSFENIFCNSNKYESYILILPLKI